MMMPLQVTILPNYIGLRDFGLLDTRAGIILPMIFSPFGVIVMHQYMKSMDNSLVEATRLETNSVVRIIAAAVIPQLRICIFATSIFIFSECWNMVEQPLLFLRKTKLKTMTIFLSDLMPKTGEIIDKAQTMPIILAASVIFMIPVFLLYMFFSDSLDQGLDLNILSLKS